jgi:hypothetical protein
VRSARARGEFFSMSSGGRSTREGMVVDAAGGVWWYGGKACDVVGFIGR